ncbi:aminotransferase class V-fold PLP-dependent enzyme [Vibrio stylophorae]|nr:SufS family cysteine desulfurase [Vibrio stylophorae]
MTPIEQAFDENPWRQQFPVLAQQVHDQPLIYLDTAASAQTPAVVIERMQHFYQHEYAAVHRGIHHLSAVATERMEAVRAQVAQFIGAQSEREIIFTKGATEAINLVAHSFLPEQAKAGDEIIITEMEHHANLVPWQMLAQQLDLTLRIWPVNTMGELAISDLKPLLNDKTILLAMTQVSNLLGAHTPVTEACDLAHQQGAVVLVDGAQAVAHQAVNVEQLGCDFYVFSGHKLYGPTGIGVLYAKSEMQSRMRPWQGGGAMIGQVTLPQGTTYAQAPWCFEAGTPHIAGIMGLGSAIEYVQGIGLQRIAAYEAYWMAQLRQQLAQMPEIEIYSPQASSILAFNVRGQHAYDVGMFLDQFGVAIRTGHHCAQPLVETFDQHAMCRVSVGLYNDRADLQGFVTHLKQVCQLLGVCQ